MLHHLETEAVANQWTNRRRTDRARGECRYMCVLDDRARVIIITGTIIINIRLNRNESNIIISRQRDLGELARD